MGSSDGRYERIQLAQTSMYYCYIEDIHDVLASGSVA